MESLLSGVPQYIIASINVLITINLSYYIMGLEEIIASRIKSMEKENKKMSLERHKTNWRLLLLAWWTLTGIAIITLIMRILPSMFYPGSVEKVHWWFISMDIIIIFGTFMGYVFLVAISYRSWKWNTWRGRKIN